VTTLRAAAIVTWVYAAGFGLSAIPVAVYLRQRGRLPTFFDMFEMYGGPWSARVSHDAFVQLLAAFLLVMLVAAWAAWLVWNGSKAGAILALALLPIEAIFWFGFALPIPWLLGAARIILLLQGWKSLSRGSS
jgi:hypothetical protein